MKYIPNNKITIKESKINGLGVFASEDIKQGEDLGFTHVDSVIPDLFPQNMIRIEWGSRINHCAKKANIELLKDKEVTIYLEEWIGTEQEGRISLTPKVIKYYKAFALRDIKKGEEICSNYADDGENNCPCGNDYVNDL